MFFYFHILVIMFQTCQKNTVLHVHTICEINPPTHVAPMFLGKINKTASLITNYHKMLHYFHTDKTKLHFSMSSVTTLSLNLHTSVNYPLITVWWFCLCCSFMQMLPSRSISDISAQHFKVLLNFVGSHILGWPCY